MGEPAQSLAALAEPAKRPIHRFTIPEKYAAKYKTIGLVQLSADEERMAYQLAGEDAQRALHEQIKASLVQVNGKSVSTADGTSDQAFNDMNPILRSLVFAAYQQLHVPQKTDVESFLGSQAVSIG